MSIFEIGMLACFGLSWPISIVRSYRSRSTKGKSVAFSFAVLIGYICGILHKAFYSLDIVIVMYTINFIMVSIDIFLWFRNRRLEKNQLEG